MRARGGRPVTVPPLAASLEVHMHTHTYTRTHVRTLAVDSEDALKYPTDEDITLARDFLHIDEPWMRGVLTDTHFFQRDRMGRLVTFVARVAQDGWARTDNQSSAQLGVLGVGISEHTAVLVEGKAEGKAGRATFSGVGPVYFLKSGDSARASNPQAHPPPQPPPTTPLSPCPTSSAAAPPLFHPAARTPQGSRRPARRASP